MRPPLPAVALALTALTPLCAPAQCTQPCASAFAGNSFDPRVSMGGPNLLLAIQMQVPTTLTIEAIEMFTGKRTGTNSVAIWSHDGAGNKPQASLGRGQWNMSTTNQWQGANLDAPVAVAANTTFWVVWGPQNAAQASVEGNGPGAQVYRASFDGGQSWNGPWQDHQWKLRLYCCRLPNTVFGQYTLYGLGCGGSGKDQPALSATGVPVIGQSFTINLVDAPALKACVLGFGGSNSSWAGVPLPFDLTPAGASGCSILASFDILTGTATDPAGSASLPVNVPNSAGLLGLDFFDQWAILDGQANTLGLVTSSAGKGTVGNT